MWITNMRPVGALAMTCLVLVGCGKGTSAKVLHGSVTYDGEKVPKGRVSFVQQKNTLGTTYTALIVDGQYRIEVRGGPPVGKYRVQVDARKTTGRKVQGFNGLERTLIDEEIRMGSEVYAGVQSPLAVEVKADSDDQFDIEIPKSKELR